jgi:ribonuclease BN (tRNA processing enzyme)
MELTVIGCSGSVSGPDSAASSYLVQAPFEGDVFSLVLDLGPGAFGALSRRLDGSEVNAIGLSHLHPDHCLDLCSFFVAAKFSPNAPWPRQPLYGPRGTAARLARAYDVEPGSGGRTEPGTGIAEHFSYHDWQPAQQIGPFDVRTVRVNHPVETYAIRLDERGTSGASLVFSGDTGPSEALTELATSADLLLVEASFQDGDNNPPNLHLTGRQAAGTGSAAGVGSVVLTHIPPWYDRRDVLAAARPHFDGALMLAEPGAHWSIG